MKWYFNVSECLCLGISEWKRDFPLWGWGQDKFEDHIACYFENSEISVQLYFGKWKKWKKKNMFESLMIGENSGGSL